MPHAEKRCALYGKRIKNLFFLYILASSQFGKCVVKKKPGGCGKKRIPRFFDLREKRFRVRKIEMFPFFFV